jgi:hypothetical protein
MDILVYTRSAPDRIAIIPYYLSRGGIANVWAGTAGVKPYEYSIFFLGYSHILATDFLLY